MPSTRATLEEKEGRLMAPDRRRNDYTMFPMQARVRRRPPATYVPRIAPRASIRRGSAAASGSFVKKQRFRINQGAGVCAGASPFNKLSFELSKPGPPLRRPRRLICLFYLFGVTRPPGLLEGYTHPIKVFRELSTRRNRHPDFLALNYI